MKCKFVCWLIMVLLAGNVHAANLVLPAPITKTNTTTVATVRIERILISLDALVTPALANRVAIEVPYQWYGTNGALIASGTSRTSYNDLVSILGSTNANASIAWFMNLVNTLLQAKVP